MIKKIGLTVLASFMLLFNLLIVPSEMSATENSAQNTNENTQDLVKAMDKYVFAEDNQIKLKEIPKNLYEKYGSENVDSIIKGIEELNTEAKNDKVVITDNETIYETNDTSFDVQGGVNKVVYKWYGRVRYFTTKTASNFAHAASKVATGAGAVSLVAGYFSLGTATVFGGLTALYFNDLAANVNKRNSGHNRGIILHLTWSSAYWTAKQ